MPSSTASCTPRTDLPSTARPCVNHRKNPPNVASLTPTPPSEPLKPSTGATVRDHRNAVRDRSESLSAINRNTCPQSPESALSLEGELSSTLSQAVRAETAFRKAFNANPRSSTTATRLARIQRSKRAHSDAVATLRQSLEANPSSRELHFDLALTLIGSAFDA